MMNVYERCRIRFRSQMACKRKPLRYAPASVITYLNDIREGFLGLDPYGECITVGRSKSYAGRAYKAETQDPIAIALAARVHELEREVGYYRHHWARLFFKTNRVHASVQRVDFHRRRFA